MSHLDTKTGINRAEMMVVETKIKFRYCKKATKVEKNSYFYKKLLLVTSKQRRFFQIFGLLKILELYSSQRPINTGFCFKMRHGFLIRGKQKVPV